MENLQTESTNANDYLTQHICSLKLLCYPLNINIMKTQTQVTKRFEIEELGGGINITYSFDEETETYNPLGEDGTPEVTDCTASNFLIESIEIDILGISFLITGNSFKQKFGKIKYQKLIDTLENASE